MILEKIIDGKRTEVEDARRRISLTAIRAQASASAAPLDFVRALRGESVALIAEIKRASPSRGTIRGDVNIASIVETYAGNGAAAISVLTEREYFQGDPGYLAAARPACHLPLLRKDFIIDEYQVYESRVLQADAILLITCLLENGQLRDFRQKAEALCMSALVEVHDERELERALSSGATLVGINNRNLADFSIDLTTTARLAPLVPEDVTAVAESGISTRADVVRVAACGADAILVGEALMKAGDVGAEVRGLTGVRRRARRYGPAELESAQPGR